MLPHNAKYNVLVNCNSSSKQSCQLLSEKYETKITELWRIFSSSIQAQLMLQLGYSGYIWISLHQLHTLSSQETSALWISWTFPKYAQEILKHWNIWHISPPYKIVRSTFKTKIRMQLAQCIVIFLHDIINTWIFCLSICLIGCFITGLCWLSDA